MCSGLRAPTPYRAMHRGMRPEHAPFSECSVSWTVAQTCIIALGVKSCAPDTFNRSMYLVKGTGPIIHQHAMYHAWTADSSYTMEEMFHRQRPKHASLNYVSCHRWRPGHSPITEWSMSVGDGLRQALLH